MTILLTLLYGLMWALWRRWLGGWIGVPTGWGRVPHVLAVILLTAPFYTATWWLWPVMAGVSLLFWLPGHRYDNLSDLLIRYGLFGLPWHFARKYWPDGWVVRTGRTYLIDGWSSVGELGAGFMYGLAFALILLI